MSTLVEFSVNSVTVFLPGITHFPHLGDDRFMSIVYFQA